MNILTVRYIVFFILANVLLAGCFFSAANAQQLPQYYQQLLNRATQAYEEERFIDTIDFLEEYTTVPSNNPDPWIMLAASHAALYDYQSAGMVLNDALETFPGHPRILMARSDLYLESGDYQKALSVNKQLHQTLEAEGDPAGLKEELIARIVSINMHLGSLAVEENRLSDAEQYFRDNLLYEPEVVHHHTNLAFVFTEQEEFEQALQTIENAVEVFPGEADLLKIQASVLSALENSESLEQVLSELVQMEPENLDIVGSYVSLLLYNQRFDKAAEFTENIIGQTELGRQRYFTLAGAYENAGYVAGQAAIYKQYLEEFPGDTEATLTYAGLLDTAGEHEKARALYREIDETHGDAATLEMLAESYLMEQKPEEALSVYDEILRRHPADVEIMWKKAIVYDELNRWDDKVRVLGQIRQETDDPGYHYEWSAANEKAGNQQEAISGYGRLADSGYFHPVMFTNLALSGRVIPGLGEGCEQLSAVFDLVLSQSISRQNELLGRLQQQNGFKEEMRTPGQVSIEALDNVSRTLSMEIIGECPTAFAQNFVQNLLRQYSNSGRARLIISDFYLQNQEPAKALEQATLAAELLPNSAEAHLIRARLLGMNHETEKEKLALERALAVDPFNEEAYTALIRIHRNLNTLDELCDKWLIKYRTSRDNEVLGKYLGEALMRAGRWADARELQSSRDQE